MTTLPPPPQVFRAAEPFYCPAIQIARHMADRRRAAAMCSPWDTVAGLRLRPLTAASYSRLVAISSPFPWQLSATPADVRNYVWFHSPEFTTDPADPAQARLFAQLERNLLPPWRRWRYSRAAWAQLRGAAYASAAATINEIMSEAFADAAPSAEGGGRVAASLEAQLIDLFARTHRWAPEYTRHVPLRQLYQILRSCDGTSFEASEARLIAAELAADHAAAVARRGAQTNPQS